MADFIRVDHNPTPISASLEILTAPDGAKIRAAFFPADNPSGSILLLTGWSEFIEKYFEVVDDLRARNLSVAMMDWRGQGRSDREMARACGWRGYFNQLRDDMRWFAHEHVRRRFDAPLYLMTHSMGGLPALMLLASGETTFSRAVLCAPMTQLFPSALTPIYSAVASAASALGLSRMNATRKSDEALKFEGNMFSTDEARHGRFRDLQIAAPDAALYSPTFGWLNDALKAGAEIHQPGYFENLRTPVRIISAGAERRIDGADHPTIAARHSLIESVEIPGALHEIMMERDEIRAAYWRAFDEFIPGPQSAL